MYLLDTNVISELRKGRRANLHVMAWFHRQQHETLYVSVMTLGEIQQGIAMLQARDPTQAAVLQEWLHGLARDYKRRVLPVTTEIARVWGALTAHQPPPVVDGLIAATALVRRDTGDDDEATASGHPAGFGSRETAGPGRFGPTALSVLGPVDALATRTA